MGVGEQRAHRVGDRVVADRDDLVDLGSDDLERLRIGDSARHAVGKERRHRCFDHAAFAIRLLVGRRMRRDDTDDAGSNTRVGARCSAGADARALTDRHEHDVGLDRPEELDPVGRDATHQIIVERRHHVQAVRLRERNRVLACGLKVGAMLDQLDAERAHRRVLLERVAVRHDDGCREPMQACREADRLTMVAARRADHTTTVRLALSQRVEINEAAAQFERADRRVVLVLDPHLGADPPTEQGPRLLRRRRERGMHDALRGFDGVAREHRDIKPSCAA